MILLLSVDYLCYILKKRVPPSTEHAHNRFESCSETKYGPTKKSLPSWSIPFPSLTWSAPVRWVRRGLVQIRIISVKSSTCRNHLICDRPYHNLWWEVTLILSNIFCCYCLFSLKEISVKVNRTIIFILNWINQRHQQPILVLLVNKYW